MKAICFYFQIHQPFRLKRYRFFDIGNDHYYEDEFTNEDILTRIAHRSYIPAAESLLHMIEESKGKFRCAISLTGVVIEQLEIFVPEFLDLLKKLADTGCVEFLAETYSHSLSSLIDIEEFEAQVKAHDELIYEKFGKHPKVLRNTELIYFDDLAPVIQSMGYKGVITEGAKHILGWKSPNYVYHAASCPKLKMLLKNDRLSDDISRDFSNAPLTADNYIDRIASTPADEQIVNLFMNLETFGDFQPSETGIFQFLEALPRFAAERGVEFITPSEAVSKLKPVAELSVLHPISWADEARDTSAWLGNKLQNEAFNKLYSVAERVRLCTDRRLKQDWNHLQSSDHFFYMSTKHFNDGEAHAMFSPYETPHQAFTNYMNVLADFLVRVEEQYPKSIDNEELNSLLSTINNQNTEIEMLTKELQSMRNNLEHLNEEHASRAAVAQGIKLDKDLNIEETPAKSACKAKAAKAPKAPKAKKAKEAKKTKVAKEAK
jgi:alpha-amylase